MPSFAIVISRVYCSGVAWPGITALFRPSMPIEIAPLRFTLAFSSSNTFRDGSRSFRLDGGHRAGRAAADHDDVVVEYMGIHRASVAFLELFCRAF